MNPSRHFQSHWDFYQDLLRGDLEDAESHRKFYDEYNAVLDMPAEYYLDTVRTVFQEHALPRGTWHVRGKRVRAGRHQARPRCSRSRANSTISPVSARPKRRTHCVQV